MEISSKLLLTDTNFLSRIRELEKNELMRKREFCYLRSIGIGRDWQERKRLFSNSYKFRKSLILDKYLLDLRLVRLVIIVSSSNEVAL